MSYSTQEPLSEIIFGLKAKRPALKHLLDSGVEPSTLHGVYELISTLIERFERGEIVERHPSR
jgi:hypothetical protein